MSRPKIPSATLPWLMLSDRAQEVLIISEANFWISHYDPSAGPKGRSYRCGGMSCYQCSIGAVAQVRVVVCVVSPAGIPSLLELRERHRAFWEKHDSLVGARIRVWKAGAAGNSPVQIKYLGHGAAVERDISRLVAAFGLPPIHVRLEAQGSLVDEREPETRG